MTGLFRGVMRALELLVSVPARLWRFLLLAVMFNPRLGPLRYVAMFAVLYAVFAVTLVYVVAPVRGYYGGLYMGESIKYSAERWLATAMYDAAGNFVGTFDPRLDSQRDVNYTGQPIELGSYVAQPDHKSIPVRTVPEHYWQCLVFHEDRHFGSWLNPFGIDITGVAKIPLTTIKRSVAAKRLRLGVGGSTLPMQLARTYYKTPPRRDESAAEKLGRKFKEWWIAPVIYAELTKGGDLTQLKHWAADHLPLAQRAGGDELNGVELTSRVVFGKEAQDLSPAEQFVLASAVNRPIIVLEGNERLNRVRLSHWRYITGVRARACANALVGDESLRASISDELTKMEYGPPDPVIKPKVQRALEEHAPQTAKLAMANPALRANVLVPDVRYGVREEMKNRYGFDWRRSVREVNLTLDVVENRTFREKVRVELAELHKKLEGRIEPQFTLDATRLTAPGAPDKRLPNIVIAAANAKGEIVRYFEGDDLAPYFGSQIARAADSGRYAAENETRRIASVGKMMAAIAIANAGQDTGDTLYTDAAAPTIGLEGCRKGSESSAVTRGRKAKVAFACSLNTPIEWRLRQIGQKPMETLIGTFGFAMPPAPAGAEGTPATTAAVRGLVAGSPQRVHHMASVILASLTGRGNQRIAPPTLVRSWGLNASAEDQPKPDDHAIVPDQVIRRSAAPLVKTLLEAPLCYSASRVRHGTLKTLSKWCAAENPELRLHFAKTGTDVTLDPDATVDAWVAGGLQFASGRAYSYVVLVGTGNTAQPWARKVHGADVAAPLVNLLLEDLAQSERERTAPKSEPRTPVAASGPVASAASPEVAETPNAEPQRPARSAAIRRERDSRQASRPPKPKLPWMMDEATRRAIFSSGGV